MSRLSALLGSSWVRGLCSFLIPALVTLGCGGGGGSNGPAYSVDVTPASLTFTVEAGGGPTPAKTLNVTFKGDGLVAGYPAGTPVPGWLAVSIVSSTTNSASLAVQATGAGLLPGTYTTTLRLVTGKADGSQYVTKDVPITCQVLEGLHAITSTLAFSAVDGQAPAAQSITIADSQTPYAWSLTVESVSGGSTDWVVLPAASGTSQTSSASITVQALARPAGAYAATLVLRDGGGLERGRIPITYLVNPGLHAETASLGLTAGEGLAPVAQTLTIASSQAPFSWNLTVEPVSGGPTDWLVLPVTSGTSQTTSATIQVQALPRVVGSYAATLVLKESSGLERGRIPVSYQVQGVYSLTGTLVTRITEGASAADLELALLMQSQLDATTGAGRQWSITSDQPWVSVTPASGNLSGPTALVAHLDPAKLWAMPNGAHAANLTVTFAGGSNSPSTVSLSLTLALTPALTVDPAATFSVGVATPPDQLTRTVKVGSNLGPAFASHSAWHATSKDAWLVPTASGDALANNTVSLALQPDALGPLPTGQYSTDVSIIPDDNRVAAATSRATLSLALPNVAHVAPYCTWVNQGEALILRGEGFAGQATLPVKIGATTIQGTVLSDTEIRVTAPPQAAPGRLAVGIQNALGLTRGESELVVLAPPAYGAADVIVANGITRMTLDPERQAVLLTGPGAIFRVRWDQGNWRGDNFPLPNASGVAVTLDGKDLLLSAGGVSIPDLFIRVDPQTLAMRQSTSFTNSYTDFYSNFSLIAGFNDGRTLIIDSDQWAESVWYPSLDPGPFIMTHGAVLLLTRDRSRLMLHTTTSSSPETYSYDAADGVFRSRPLSAYFYGKAWGISHDGGRLVASNAVYDQSFSYIGSLNQPESSVDAVAVAPNGQSVYTLAQSAGATAWVLRRTDISAVMGPYTSDATPLVFDLPVSHTPLSMLVSEDGSTLFLLTTVSTGNTTVTHLFVVPLN